jgi:hypothetical protein
MESDSAKNDFPATAITAMVKFMRADGPSSCLTPTSQNSNFSLLPIKKKGTHLVKTTALTSVIVLLIGLISLMPCIALADDTPQQDATQEDQAQKMKMADELTNQLFPKDTLIDSQIQMAPPAYREAFKKSIEKDFNHAAVQKAVAETFASEFSTDELTKILDFSKKDSAKVVMEVAGKKPGEKAAQSVETTPTDTKEMREAEAKKLAEIMTEKTLVLDTLKVIVSDLPEDKRNQVLQMAAKVFDDEEKLAKMREDKVEVFVDAMTTPQLKEVATFYSDPLGKKFLKSYALVGKAMRDAFMKEVRRISEAKQQNQL